MPDEVILQDELLTKDEAEICLRQEAVHVLRVLADQLVKNVLQDGADLGEGEHVILALVLRLLILLSVEGEVLEWQLGLLGWSSELG